MKKWFHIDNLMVWLPITIFFLTIGLVILTSPKQQQKCQDGILYVKSENRSIWRAALDSNDNTYIKCIAPLTQDVP